MNHQDEMSAKGEDQLAREHYLGPDTTTPSLVAEVMAEIQAIPKGRDSEMGYKYRGIDDVQAALHPLLAERGLFLRAETVDRQVAWHEVVRRNGNVSLQKTTELCVRYSIVGSDGGVVHLATVWGEAAGSDDKGTNAAYSSATKNAIFTAFVIPTEDQRDTEEKDETRNVERRQDRVEVKAAKWGVFQMLAGPDPSDETEKAAKEAAANVWGEILADGIVDRAAKSISAEAYDRVIDFVKRRIDPFLEEDAAGSASLESGGAGGGGDEAALTGESAVPPPAADLTTDGGGGTDGVARETELAVESAEEGAGESVAPAPNPVTRARKKAAKT